MRPSLRTIGGTLTLRCRSEAPVCTIRRKRRLMGGSWTMGVGDAGEAMSPTQSARDHARVQSSGQARPDYTGRHASTRVSDRSSGPPGRWHLPLRRDRHAGPGARAGRARAARCPQRLSLRRPVRRSRRPRPGDRRAGGHRAGPDLASRRGRHRRVGRRPRRRQGRGCADVRVLLLRRHRVRSWSRR